MNARGVDLHNHVIPGVDDGARDAEQGLEALRALAAEDVGVVVATPHLAASLAEDPLALRSRLAEFEAGFEELKAVLEDSDLELRLECGAEVKLDTPELDLSDPRTRLAGTDFVLVEFPGFRIPPFAERQLSDVRAAGWIPLLAHPERYLGIPEAIDTARLELWREEGTFFQVNAGSLVGKYGEGARRAARAMLERGWVHCFASDYHCRGAPRLRETRDLLEAAAAGEGGEAPEEVAELLFETNPGRVLAGEEPLPVPPIGLAEGMWGSLRGLFR